MANKIWYFEWAGGGYNSVSAPDRSTALKLAQEKGQPSKEPGGMTVTLVPIESTLRVVTVQELIEIDQKWASLCD